MNAVGSSETLVNIYTLFYTEDGVSNFLHTSVNFYQTTRRHIINRRQWKESKVRDSTEKTTDAPAKKKTVDW
jgi:hypothetical protein